MCLCVLELGSVCIFTYYAGDSSGRHSLQIKTFLSLCAIVREVVIEIIQMQEINLKLTEVQNYLTFVECCLI
jgi:hypothetical protein